LNTNPYIEYVQADAAAQPQGLNTNPYIEYVQADAAAARAKKAEAGKKAPSVMLSVNPRS